ncbi:MULTISPECIES: IS110 family transposase [Paenibacillus]|uniref:IS110 family transposase n=2 Tax=Paenibacillus TaxID=44249 RepID=A0A1R0WTR0_9BACL|nr:MULTISPECIES: IS110 family transposase [Paenibacillus]ETT55813.1 transposase IS116/IS110/IS902 family protein [Paenibacillus sp. FSL H8-237]OMD20932.1 IS110 family transposase [Paenibacillus odorifer]OMD34180.1 IS110 family transposase [Paenibacillus odorifer]OME11616.1 IS110 family transposase [Paenibacillus odorifer]OME28101.1 IS110 family transposase [Paenibacillus odorifer]
MKFKAQDKQNQLIENITVHHLVIGVDIAQEVHVARAVSFRGIALGTPLEFGNHREGFDLFERWIQDLLKSYKLSSVIVGMEPTGHYWFSLARWLLDQGMEPVLVNPHLVKKNKENRDNTPSKSDHKDALVIADMVKNGYYSPVRFHPEDYEELRILMANRETVTKRLNAAVNQIHRWVDIVFPELRQVFKILTCTSAIATLRLFPLPKEIRLLNTEQVLAGWKQYVKRHAGVKRAELLISLAKSSVGATQALHAYKLHLGQLLEEYDLAQRQLEQIEHELRLILKRIPYAQKLLEIRGIYVTNLAGVLGEAGDLSGYTHGNALLRHAGLNLAEASSGKWRGKMVLSKRGRPRLRHFLYLMTMSMVMTNPEIRAAHRYNVEEKKLKKMKSIMKLIGKVARMLVALAKSSTAYEPIKVFPQAA